MANEQKIFFYPENGGAVEYTKVEQREGTHGLVHIVQKEGEYLALKEPINPGQVKLFLDYRDAFKGKALPRHYVQIKDYGCLGDSDSSGDNNRPAMLMPYAGLDLQTILENFEGFEYTKDSAGSNVGKQWRIKNNVLEAFGYKVMLTVLDALEDAHNRKMPHSDLKPRNVLVNVPYGFGSNKNNLEQDLLESRVQICDPIFVKEQATILKLRQLSLNTDFNLYFRLTVGGATLQEQDLFAAVAMYAWMSNRNVGMFPTQFLENLGHFDELGNKMAITSRHDAKSHKSTWSFPSAKSLRGAIQKEADKFYFIGEKKSANGSDKYPVVVRPVDRFRTYVAETLNQDPIGLDQIKKIAGIENATNGFSYAAMRCLYGDAADFRRDEDELRELGRVYFAALCNATSIIDSAKVQDILQKETLEKKMGENVGAITLLEKEIAVYYEELTVAQTRLPGISTALATPGTPIPTKEELKTEREKVYEKISTLPEKIGKLRGDVQHKQAESKAMGREHEDYLARINSQSEAIVYIAQLVLRKDFPAMRKHDSTGAFDELLQRNIPLTLYTKIHPTIS